MGWGILVVLMLAGLLAGLVYIYRKDRSYLNQRTRDVLGPKVRQEIEAEIEESKRRQEKFKNALESAAKSSKSQDNSLTSK
ncbi:MAG: hypothetical protein COV45_05900 [Deltaproteobacteria bacterium CG11_big_fil_rev_8_21_14_0_20_47_16]|nr:MAG: hypothetical protein COV45_05900 [Deltaproteobacteria bacterium CG11_big_fil_rev_8_21_14_0_20_47_16]